MGWAYLPRVGIPSLLSTGDHDYHPVEQDANARAIQYFYKRTNGNVDWNFRSNPIGVRENNWTMADFNTDEFQKALGLIRSQTKVRIKDYISWVSMPFVALTGIENGTYYDGQQPYRRYSGRLIGTNRRSIKY